MKYKYMAILFSTGGNDWKFITQSFFLILACVFIFILTYYITKYISRARISGKMRGNVCIMEVISVGVQSSVQLIKAGKKYLLIGVSKDRIVFLTEVNPDDLEFPENKPLINNNVFDKYLNKFLNKNNSDGDDDDAK